MIFHISSSSPRWTPCRIALATILMASLACGPRADDGGSVASAVPICAETDRGEWTNESEVVIADNPSPPCRLTLDTTVIRSYSAAEADSLDLAQVREVDRHGNFYIQGYEPGVISVLSSRGDLIARFGREGTGPGEFPSGYLGVEVSDLDSVYIQDNRLRWTVFGPDRRFVRTMSLGQIQAGANMRCVLADGSVISSATIHGGRRPATMRIFDPDGELVREFGHPAINSPSNTSLTARGVSCGHDSAAWALPNPLEPAFTLERWGRNGDLLNTLTRDASWFDAGPSMTRTEAMSSRPHSTVRQVFEAHRGLLFAMIVNADSRWQPTTRDQWEARQGELYDVRFEALDAISGELLGVMLVDDQGTLPNARILRDGRSHELVVDESGGVRLIAYTLQLSDH